MVGNHPLGEKEFIAKLGRLLHPSDGLSWRDDCVITPLGEDLALLYSIDRPENIYSSGERHDDLRRFGRWSASVVSSDVIACGAEPRGISFDVGVSDMTPDEILVWASGVVETCREYGMRYEGGNLGVGSGITGVAWGIQKQDKILRRSGARDGSVLLVTWELGSGWAVRLWQDADLDKTRLGEHAERKNTPYINLDGFRAAWATGAIQASMDLTDGAVEFAFEIFERSGLGVLLEPRREQPWALEFVADELGLPRQAFYFEPGYDTPFAHGWCVSSEDANEIKAILRAHGIPSTTLGTVTSKLDGVYCHDWRNELIRMPRYWDDKLINRGNSATWHKLIVPLFAPDDTSGDEL